MKPEEWLDGVAAGAAKISSEERIPPAVSGYVTGSADKRYGIGKLLGVSGLFKLYECIFGDRCATLKIAESAEENRNLDREALVLRSMAAKALELAADYENFFPALIDSFVSESQDNRRINILGFPKEIADIGQLTPTSALTDIEHVRVDPKTGAWILGKILKVLAFAHSQGIANGRILGSNILVERDMHGLIIFDWTCAKTNVDVAPNITREELSQAGYAATIVMGGDPKTGKLPESDQLSDKRFEDFLHGLTHGAYYSASEAHRDFYRLIRDLWVTKFHPYTTIDTEKEE